MIAWLGSVLLFSVETPAAQQPTLLIPATENPPTIDGKIDDAEWADAAAVTGLIQPQSSLLTPPGGVIYVKHDAERLYLAFRCKLLPGMVPTRRYRQRDEPVYMDSHQVELWLTPPVPDAKTWAYQFIGNAYGAVFDNLQHPELGSTSVGWNGNWEFKNRFERGKYWDGEISIAAKDLSMPEIKPGQVWRGMVGIAWPQRSWPFTGGWYKNVPLHARWVMGGDAAALQVLGVDRLLDNQVDLTLQVLGGTAGGTFRADVEVDGTKAGGTIDLKPGERKPLALRRSLPAADEARTMKLGVAGPGGKVLFEGQWQFKPGLKPSGRPPREHETPFPAAVNYAPEAKALRYWADVLDYPRRRQLAAVRVTITPKGKLTQTIAEAAVTQFEYDQVEGYLWLPKNLTVGGYEATFKFLDSAGRVLDANTKEFQVVDLKKTFHWWNNTIGNRFTVDPDFEPIRVLGKRITVWGRTYDFSAGPFPAAVTSRRAQMLARPIVLKVQTRQGTSACRPVGDVRVSRASETEVTFEGKYESDELVAKVQGRLEFDGMVFYDLSIAPKGKDVKVDRVYLSMAVRPEHAMYYHTTAGGWSGAIDFVADEASGEPFWTSKNFAEFIPYVGFSDDDRALQWFADNDHNWAVGDDFPCVELRRRDGEVELQVNLVSRSGSLPALQNVQFGLIATPVKPLPRGWRNPSLHYGRLCDAEIAFFYGAGHGGGLGLHDTAGLLKVLGVDVPAGGKPPEVLQRLSADAQGKVDKLSSAPDGVINCPFQNAQMLFEGYRSKAFATLFPGDWRIYPPGGWFHLAPTRSYQDFFVWHFDKWVKHLGVRGVYFDEAYFPMDKNVFNGSGKLMPDGSIRPSVNLMRQRSFMRRVRQTFIDRDVAPFVWVHTSNFMAPHAISFCQVAMFGEDRAPTATNDYIDTAPAVLFRAIGRSQKYGLVPISMNQVGRGGGTAKGPLNRMARQVCGWCWMFDTGVELHSVSRGRAQQWLRTHWGIAKDDVRYHPYWKQKLVATDEEDVIVSVWTRPGTALLQVFNLSRKAKTARLGIDPKTLGLKAGSKLYDLESSPELAALKMQLQQFDIGKITDPTEVRQLLSACRQAGEAPYQVEKLKVLGELKMEVPARDFVLLLAQ